MYNFSLHIHRQEAQEAEEVEDTIQISRRKMIIQAGPQPAVCFLLLLLLLEQRRDRNLPSNRQDADRDEQPSTDGMNEKERRNRGQNGRRK